LFVVSITLFGANKGLFVVSLALFEASKGLFVVSFTLFEANKALFVASLTVSGANKALFVAFLTLFEANKAREGGSARGAPGSCGFAAAHSGKPPAFRPTGLKLFRGSASGDANLFPLTRAI